MNYAELSQVTEPNEYVRTPEDCPHFAWTGDEGPVAKLGRMPRRWKCDGCGLVKVDPSAPDSLIDRETL